jgi:hypothetical protein
MILYKSMINKYKTTHVVVFKTGNLYELDMASCALEGKNIKFYKQEETSSALRLNPDFAVDFVARCSKPQRNAQLERFCDAGIIIIMLRNKTVSQTTTRATGSFVSSGG